MAKEAEERFGSMDEFASAVSAGVPVGRPIRWRIGRRQRPAAMLIAAAVVALVALLIRLVLVRETPQEAGMAPALQPAADTQAMAAPIPDTASVPAPAPAPPPAVTPPDSASAPRDILAKSHDTVTTPRPMPKPTRQRPRTARAVQPPPAASVPQTPPPPRSGFLTVNANPYGTVWIDDVEIGDTPIVGREISPGDHAIRISREGYRAESTTVTITAGNEVRLSRTLVRQP
jgi:hypothetical protein